MQEAATQLQGCTVPESSVLAFVAPIAHATITISRVVFMLEALKFMAAKD